MFGLSFYFRCAAGAVVGSKSYKQLASRHIDVLCESVEQSLERSVDEQVPHFDSGILLTDCYRSEHLSYLRLLLKSTRFRR